MAADEAADLDSALHTLDSLHNVLVNQGIIKVWHLREVDRGLVEFIILSKTVPQVLVEVLGDEGSDGCHQLCRNHDHIEQDAEGGALVLYSSIITLHARTVQPNVPVGQILEEGNQVAHDIV